MFRRKFLMAAIVAGIAALAGPTASQAAFSVTMQSGGSGPFVVTDNLASGTVPSGGYFDFDLTTTSPNTISIASSQVGNLNGFSFSLISTSNSPGSPTAGGLVTSSVISLSNNNATAERITLTFFSDGFAIPGAGPLSLSTVITSLIGDLTPADLGAGLTQSQIYSTGSGSTSASTNPAAYFQSGTTLITGPVSFTSTGTYSNQLVLSLYLEAGEDAFLQVGSRVIAPAPAGLILAATALPFVGLLRRRLRRPETTTAA